MLYATALFAQRFLFEIEGGFKGEGPTTEALHKGPQKPCYATGGGLNLKKPW